MFLRLNYKGACVVVFLGTLSYVWHYEKIQISLSSLVESNATHRQGPEN